MDSQEKRDDSVLPPRLLCDSVVNRINVDAQVRLPMAHTADVTSILRWLKQDSGCSRVVALPCGDPY